MELTKNAVRLPMVEIFETIEGEGMRAGFPTIFVRLFNCNLRCTWCDTPYSYAPSSPEHFLTINEIVAKVRGYSSTSICLTGGEPLMHQEKSLHLLQALCELSTIHDIHIETNGAIDLAPFHEARMKNTYMGKKVRFILDYKLPGSGENSKMILNNFTHLSERDEIKFVIASYEDFLFAKDILCNIDEGIPLFSPAWGMVDPQVLVKWILSHKLSRVKLNLQLHKIIWDPDRKGV